MLQSQVIDWLKFPLSIAVVFIHAFNWPSTYVPFSANLSSFNGMDFYNLVRSAISHSIAHVAVPIFFLIAGFLFFLKISAFNSFTGWKSKLQSLFTL